jgi:transcription elongation factor GreA
MDMSGKSISPEIMARMLRLETSATEKCNNISKDLNEDFENIQNKNLQDIKIRSESRNMVFYNEEISKIDKYTEDKLYRVEKELKDVKDRIKTLMREERQAETIAAKTAIQEEIAELELKIRNAKIIDESEIDTKTVQIGNLVKLLDIEFNEEVEYTIVGSTEVNLAENKVSNVSPIGKALMGKKVGDSFELPNGNKGKITEIE